MWFCPGANHAPHHAPQEYIDKYKGKFDDGYEAYREWVLPRMIEKGILPEDTELTPINPLPEGTYSPVDAVRPWDTLNDDEKKLFARMAEVYAGFSEYTDAQVGRIIDYLEETGQLDNTLIFYCADNGASGEGSPERLGQREQVLQRLSRRPARTTSASSTSSAARTPTTTTRRAGRWRSPRRSRCSSATRYAGGICDPLVDPLAEGHQGQGRGPPPVPPRDRHRPDDPRVLRAGVAGDRQGYEQFPLPGVSMRYSFDDARRADAEEAPVLRDARHARDLAGRLEGRRRARADVGQGRLRQGRLGALPRRRGPRRGARPRRPAPREAAAADRRLVRGGREVRRAAARRPPRVELLDDPRPSREPPRRRSSTTRTRPVPESVAANMRGRSYKILADVEITDAGRRGRDLRARLPLRRARAVHQGPQAPVRLQLPRHPPEQQLVSERARAREARARHGVRQGAQASTASRIGTAKLYVDDQVVAEGDADAARPLHALRRGPLRRPRHRRPGQQGVQVAVPRSPAARSWRSRSTSATTCTWTSSATSPRRWRGTSEADQGRHETRDGRHSMAEGGRDRPPSAFGHASG